MAEIRIVLADDHAIVRNGIKALLESSEEINVVAEAANGKEALTVCKEKKPDVLVIDIRMPEMTGLEATKLLSQYSPNTKALILSMHDMEEYVFQAVESGAYGYLLKDTSQEEFVKAIIKVNNGEKYFSSDISHVFVNRYLNVKGDVNANEADKRNDFDLTPRELETLKFIIKGYSNKDIAEQFEKSIRTIENHRFSIMKKLDVHNAVELINAVKTHGLLDE